MCALLEVPYVEHPKLVANGLMQATKEHTPKVLVSVMDTCLMGQLFKFSIKVKGRTVTLSR